MKINNNKTNKNKASDIKKSGQSTLNKVNKS